MSAKQGTGYVECDGCGRRFAIGNEWPPALYLIEAHPDGGWHVFVHGDGKRIDYCPRCKHNQPSSVATT